MEDSMLRDISDRLTQAIERKRLKAKLERNLKQVESDLEAKSTLLNTLERQLQKEQVDVERLERLSLTGLFYSVLGSRDQQVDKERQEMLAAQLKYQQAKRTVDALRADQAHLQQQLGELRGVEDEYTALLARKENLLRESNSQVAAELMRLAEQVANRGAEQREIDEAIAAAQGVQASLEQVIDSLQSAEGWGTWDMLGGGLLSTAVKHARIDDARDAVQDVQAGMDRFTRELADVQRSTDLKIEISGLDIFADYFFDGLIVDWIVQSKIGQSLDQARRAQERITQAADDLRRLRNEVENHVKRLRAQRAALIEQS
jgi:DNA repair exonuclease SbcCD ATPase subunit